MLKPYLKQIISTTSQGDAREESYYGHLSGFLLNFAHTIGKTKTQITTLPKATEAGNPDFRVWDGDQNIVGYIEAKKPGENLDVIERTEQLKRYLKTFPNVILTDFYEFRLYRKGEKIDQAFIARASLARKGIPPPVENEEKFFALLEKFFAFSLPKVTTAEQLAKELAIRTRFLRDEVISVEMEQQQKGKGELYGFYETFKKFLIANLSEKDFADLFSQTITYGLFAARTRSTNGFNRKLAYDLIPRTIGILRNVFRFVSQGDLPKHMEVMVDDIAEVLNAADASNILHQYFKAGKGEDPIVHFYETFLSEYDPATREKRGVYYTPEPVVRYIVRSVHQVLKTHFGLDDGLASREVTLLDPAGGTLTFPAEAIKLAVKEYTEKYGDGGVHKLISEHILPNFYAFELMMAPYAIGHIKISFLLEELGYTMKDDERFKLYLTNTLDMEDLSQTTIPGLESLSDESHEAGKVKKNEPILVIVGNPPYSGHSANISENVINFKLGDSYVKGYFWDDNKQQALPNYSKVKRVNKKSKVAKLLQKTFIGELLQDYYFIDGKKLNEKNPKWLQDDYVKFLRFAQWKIQKVGNGIVAMITNHGYIDNPTFRGMRQSLVNTFNEIYILDLHGNSLRKEVAPDGGKDENVFDIKQGVAIAIMVKVKEKQGCQIYVGDLFGNRECKYNWLDNKSFSKNNYDIEKPTTPFYFLKKTRTTDIEKYLDWMSVQDIFPISSNGLFTARDSLTIGWNATEIWKRVQLFCSMDAELARQTFDLGPDVRDWKVKFAQADLLQTGPIPERVNAILYRPFDIRFTYYTGRSRGFHCMPRGDIMQHMERENLAITIGRQGQAVGTLNLWNLCFITKDLVDLNLFYRGGAMVFPLYLVNNIDHKRDKPGFQSILMFEPELEYDKVGRKPNIAPKVFELLEKSFKHKPTPEQIMYYCYAVMHSNIYREKYAEFLKIDFPRIPFTSDYKLFLQLAELGNQLADLHLLISNTLNRPIVKYLGQGEDLIEKPVYDANSLRIYINSGKYFEGISPEMWNYHIGGYKVLEKYLKDRKGRQMSDPATYCKIATAIAETIKIQSAIDELYEEVEELVI